MEQRKLPLLNIVFDRSTAGILRTTKEPGSNSRIRKEDILCLEFCMDIGYLQEEIDSAYRIELPDRLVMGAELAAAEANKSEYAETGKRNLENWNLIKRHLEKNLPIRIWYSNAPHALCGFYHLCTLLRNCGCDVFALCAPQTVLESNGKECSFINGWGSFDHPLDAYFGCQRKLDAAEIRAYAAHWDQITKENAALRAVLSGFPISVSEDFYDDFLQKQIPETPFREGQLIQNTYAAYHLGVNAAWLELRIQRMIDSWGLVVMDASDELPLHRLLRAEGRDEIIQRILNAKF